jgi:Kelch motif
VPQSKLPAHNLPVSNLPVSNLPVSNLPVSNLPPPSPRSRHVRDGSGVPVRSRAWARRRSEGGLGAILFVDAMALLLVLASGPAAYLWLGQSHPNPMAAAASPSIPAAQASEPGSSAAPGSGAPPSPSPGAGSSGASASPPPLVYGTGKWTQTDPLAQARWASASVLLHDGRVLVVGGSTGSSSYNAVATASIIDPSTGHWTEATDMLQPRAYAMAVTLADGSVLVAGGSRDGQPLDTAERYNPDNGTWVAAGRMNLPRTQATLTLLPDGRALAVGGGIEGGPDWRTTASAEIFDPTTNTWTLAAPMSEARASQTATLLPDGEVLVAGGSTTYYGESGLVTADAEIYNPKSNSWRAAAPMGHPRYVFGAVLLANGKVLVAGGWYATSNSDPSHPTAEIYDPAKNLWTDTGSMSNARAQFGLVRLRDGRVLAVGGVDPAYRPGATCELYDPATGIWQATGPLAAPVMYPAIQALPDGRAFVAGGGLNAVASVVTPLAEIYAAPPR